ncbi:MAG: O-antigen ligase family protein [Candidatus Omnitrophica bacterium]|nr:O-antigen ligase family protein [Candidatus Omnitrophota bacterium]
MKFALVLWLLVWAGMYTNISYVQQTNFLASKYSFIQGIRSLFPLVAIFLCLLTVFASRYRRIPFFRSPLELFFFYAFVGFIAAVMSTDPVISLYMNLAYLAPIMVTWYAMNKKDPLDNIRTIIHANYVILTLLVCIFLPSALGRGLIGWNSLPFNLGEVNRNGIGRYALVVMLVSFVRGVTPKKMKKLLYGILFVSAIVLFSQAQSRTALLGLSVTVMLLFFFRRIGWRFIFILPLFTYLIWLVGYQWRAEADFERLISLTGREQIWQQGLEVISTSPFYGWGFLSDRLLLEGEHMHNAYLSTLIQTGFLGTIFFVLGFIGVWVLIIRGRFFKRARELQGAEKFLLIESIVIIGILSVRSLFESTATFYGVDLVILVPHIAYIQLMAKKFSAKTQSSSP